jgi:ELWxxDGT repeat protein
MNLTGTRNRAPNRAGICGRVIAPCAQALEPRLLFAQEAEPAGLETLGPYVLFTQFDFEYGRELWRSDGTPGGTRLVKDINPGPAGGAGGGPGILTVGDVAYFAADDGIHGTELWRTNGTPDGTTMVADLTPGIESTPVGEFFVDHGVFYLSNYLDNSYRVYRVLGPGSGLSYAGGEALVDWLRRPKLHGRGFSVRDGTLWAKDGPDAPDTPVLDAGAGGGQFFETPIVAGDKLFLRGGGDRLYVSDGTAAGTRLVAAAPQVRTRLVGAPDGRAYFGQMAADAMPLLSGHGYVWASDGTDAGTLPVAEVGSNVQGSLDLTPTPLAFNAGRLYVRATLAAGGLGLTFLDVASGETGQVPAELSPNFWMRDYRLADDVAFLNGDLVYGSNRYGDVFAATPTGVKKPAVAISFPRTPDQRLIAVPDGVPVALNATVAAPGHDATHDPLAVTWDFDSDGAFDDGAGESLELSPSDVARFAAPGFFYARAHADDGRGAVATSLASKVLLVPSPPSAAPDAIYTYAQNGEVEFAVVYSDPSGVDPSSLVGNDELAAVSIDPAGPLVPARYVSIDADAPGPSRTVVYRATLPPGTTIPPFAQLYIGIVGQARDMLGNAGLSGTFPPLALYELSADGTGPAPGAGLGVTPNVRGTLANVFTLAGETASTPLAARRVYGDVNGNNAFDAGEPNATSDLDGKFGFFAPPGATVRVELSDDWVPAEGTDATAPVNLRANQPDFKFTMTRPAVVDVLVAFAASQSGQGFGVMDQIREAVRNLVLGANQVFANSDANAVLNLAGVLPVFYESTGHAKQDLFKLRKLGDGPLDEVHAERERLGADVTVLVTADESRDRVAGISFQLQRPGGEPGDAFAVVTSSADPMLFAHEVGHLFGAGHERVVTKYGVRPYAHGFVYHSPDPLRSGYKDVMSYGDGGQLNLPFLSSPRVTYEGVPLGDAAADNARTVREFAPVLAAYRAAPTGGPAGQAPSVDLVATMDVKVPPRVRPGATLNATVTLTNRGTASAAGRGGASVYLSHSPARQTPDVSLGSVATALNLRAGKSKRVRLRLKLPATLAPGTYYLFGSAGGGPIGADVDPSNNERIAGPDVVVAG